MTIAERLEQKVARKAGWKDAWKDAWKERLKSPGYCVPASENGDDAGAD